MDTIINNSDINQVTKPFDRGCGTETSMMVSLAVKVLNEKTTFLLSCVDGKADINIDAQILAGEEAAAGGKEAAGEIGSDIRSVGDRDAAVAMQDGCICCTLRDDLLLEVPHCRETKRRGVGRFFMRNR